MKETVAQIREEFWDFRVGIWGFGTLVPSLREWVSDSKMYQCFRKINPIHLLAWNRWAKAVGKGDGWKIL